ncbi:tRNA (adenine(37)-N6)-methyltransferase [Pectinophora gossypiella]|nr:tRNA (adenine(37)-N6)-methyltransferase [Pectinophora gossypiella]
MADTVEHYRNQIALARTEIKNLRQQLSALKHEHLKEIKLIKSALNGLRCGNCAEAATTLLPNNSNYEPVPSPSTSNPNDGILYKPIGIIETSFQNKRGVPRQPVIMAKAKGTVIIDPNVFNNPEHALSGLEEFSHMWIIFHFHATESTSVPAKVSPPRLRGARRGVLSTRAPHRPCALGLSLVKIQSIEGNKIHFLGVDMVNGTPVLDIKPYIPQYDYPSMFGDTIASMERPPTEGISDATDAFASLVVDDDGYDTRSLSPRLTHPMRIDTTSTPPPLSRSPFEDELPSPDRPTLMTPVSPSDSPSSVDILDISARSPITRPDSERGAPDGQERFTPPQSAQTNTDGIRIAPWISNPPAHAYEVQFTDDVIQRLNDLIGDRAQVFKTNIQSLLSEDPRSNYVRTRYPDHEYSCVLEDLSISCVFDTSSSVCTIIAVRSAEDMQS